jgi:hypothetical protein
VWLEVQLELVLLDQLHSLAHIPLLWPPFRRGITVLERVVIKALLVILLGLSEAKSKDCRARIRRGPLQGFATLAHVG